YAVVVIGTVKGHSEADFASAGYGMATPSGYRTVFDTTWGEKGYFQTYVRFQNSNIEEIFIQEMK
ncbi:MAG: pyruvate carboxylase, partial [Streblomastix strix]